MSAEQTYTITIGDKTIKINKIIINNEYTNEYEFIMDYQYLQYYGKSFLKELKLNKFQDYLKFYEQKEELTLKEINDDFYLSFPIPFTDNFEVITLKKPELTESAEFKILLKKQQDEFTKKINAQQEEIQKLKKQLNPTKEYIVIDSDSQIFTINPKDFHAFKTFIIKNIDKAIPKDKMTDNIMYTLKEAKTTKNLIECFASIGLRTITFRCLFNFLKHQNYFITDIIVDGKNRNSNDYYDYVTSAECYLFNHSIKYIIEYKTLSENKMIDYTMDYDIFTQQNMGKYPFTLIKFGSKNNSSHASYYNMFITYE